MCDLCSDSWRPYINHRYIKLAIDYERHAFLCQCPQCGSLYEVFPEELIAPQEVTREEARAKFPGAL